MKKTDLYSKIVQTIIAIALVALVLKDVNFVSKAQANELDLSEMKIEQVENEDRTVFYIYENSKLKYPVSRSSGGFLGGSTSGSIVSDDVPQYVITNKTGSLFIK